MSDTSKSRSVTFASHCWRNLQRPVNPSEIVREVVQRNGRFVILQLPAKAVGQTRVPPPGDLEMRTAFPDVTGPEFVEVIFDGVERHVLHSDAPGQRAT
jgi:hypothetical protein